MFVHRSVLNWPSEIDTLRQQMESLLSDWTAPVECTARPPAIALQVTDSAVILRAELPGVAAEQLDIQVAPRAVAIAGEYSASQRSETSYYRSEFRSGQFRRVVNLPVPVQYDQAIAEFKDGILTLTLPKAATPQPQIHRVQLVRPETPETPVAEAPVAEAPVSEPPVSEPPVSEPPVSVPPVAEPQSAQPLSTSDPQDLW